MNFLEFDIQQSVKRATFKIISQYHTIERRRGGGQIITIDECLWAECFATRARYYGKYYLVCGNNGSNITTDIKRTFTEQLATSGLLANFVLKLKNTTFNL